MCGIIGQTGEVAASAMTALDAFFYRGPDAKEVRITPDLALGHLRLSIIDTNVRSNQPLLSEDEKFSIVFNGEIYNFRELREELAQVQGVRFKTESDTEVLLEGYRTWGKELLPRLRGMFAFAIYDRDKHAVFLARDHAGIKPLYYSLAGGRLSFASEAKGVAGLLRSAGIAPHISERSIGLYLALGYVPSPWTLVQEIEKLPRGSWLTYDCASLTADRGRWEPESFRAENEEDLAEAVRASVLEHTIADVPVGVFFSGGIDSSVIALALRDAGINLQTYSVLVEGRTHDEPFFTAIAKHLGVKAQVHNFGLREFENTFEHVLSKMDDPISDPSIFPTAFISRIAAREVKVVLSGEGGDELFLGYPRSLAIAHMHSPAGEAYGWFDALIQRSPPFKGKRAAAAAFTKGMRYPVSYYLTQASLAFDRTPLEVWRETHEMLASGDPLWLDRDWYLENMLLRKTDMATMYASIEGRVPLLGTKLWSATPALWECNARGDGKQTLRTMLRTAVPEKLIDRPKSGFGIPLTHMRAQSKLFKDSENEAKAALSKIFPSISACLNSDNNAPLSYGLMVLYRSLRNLELV